MSLKKLVDFNVKTEEKHKPEFMIKANKNLNYT